MPIWFAHTVKTRHLMGTKKHDLLRDAKKDAQGREAEGKDWVIVRQSDPTTKFGVGENAIVSASSQDAWDYAAWCLFPERR